ncbi:MAG: DNA polymerase III subunit gamma/tau [Anaerolineales bacterium]|jgi:DNA polymerase-3 subunit gamma/tau|nr:DNA polymerase III subunit gamma/tau [Anaerolineales bacterium]
MTQALYRKWRPLAWDEVVSQEHVIQTLKNAVTGERVAHAYLFSGPRGTGKTTAARLLAKAVNCLDEDKSKRPCNECLHCLAVNESRFMDLIEIDAASNTSVEDVRDLRDKINFAPSQGRYKVYIIDEVHMLSTAAFNALLKTLEEPPPHAIFILATTEIHKIPATVLSRCQRHEFRRFPLSEITRRLELICKEEKLKADPEALTMIARQSAGGMRDAISLLDQLASTADHITLALAQTVLGTAASQSVIGLVQAVIEKEPAQGLTEIQHALDGGADARSLARQVVEYLRGLLLIQLGNADQVEATPDARKQMSEHAQSLPTTDVLRMMRSFNAAATDTRGGWQPSLGLELAFAEMLETPAPPQPLTPPLAAQERKSEAAGAPRPSAAPRRAAPPPPPAARSVPGLSPDPVQVAQSRPAAGGDASLVVPLQKISSAWKQISAAIKSQNPNLAALLNSCKVLDVNGNVVTLGFASDILLAKFDKPEHTQLTEHAISEAIGLPVTVQAVVAGGKNALPAHVKPDSMVAAALQNGGEIVDTQ